MALPLDSPPAAAEQQSSSRGWTIGLWVVQGLLAAAFLSAGVVKGFQPLDAVGKMMPWVLDVPGWLVRFIGFAELAGALGLILPAATRILPILTPLAALGLTTVMILAAGFHASRGELAMVPINLVIGSLAGFIAWGRLRKAPLKPR
jgi:hypothetical protein